MTFWGAFTIILMILGTLVSFVPFVPGPALVWAIAFIYAAVTGFSEISITMIVIMTLLMILGSTSDWWTRMIGLGSEGDLSCGSFAASTIGAIAGTIFIPVPIIGTLLGAAAGVMALVFYQEEDWGKAFKSARGIMKAWLASFFVEFVVSISIAMMFIYSLINAWGFIY